MSRSLLVLKKINLLLSIVIVSLCLLMPGLALIPEVTLASSRLLNMNAAFTNDFSTNLLLIDKIQVAAKINEGLSSNTLAKGIWRLPYVSSPDQGGNTVLIAHRAAKLGGPDSFYHLDKLEIGDKININWKGKKYEYRIFEIFEALPQAIDLENNTPEPVLTLYTCAPLWTSEKRLVVRARLLNK